MRRQIVVFIVVVIEYLKSVQQSPRRWLSYKKRLSVRALFYVVLGVFSITQIFRSIRSRNVDGNHPDVVHSDEPLALSFSRVIVGNQQRHFNNNKNETTKGTASDALERTKPYHSTNHILNACTSPESSRPWPVNKFQYYHQNMTKDGSDQHDRLLSATTATSHLSCDLTTPSQFTWFLRETMGKTNLLSTLLKRHGCQQVVFGTAFTDESEQNIRRWLTTIPPLQQTKNSSYTTTDSAICSFVFIVGDFNFLQNEKNITEARYVIEQNQDGADGPPADTTTSKSTTSTPVFLLPIPRHILPYESVERNSLLVKYMGHLFFLQPPHHPTPTKSPYNRYVKTVTWQDTHFYLSVGTSIPTMDDNSNHSNHDDHRNGNETQYYRHRNRNSFFLPSEYYSYDSDKVHQYDRPCVTVIALPKVIFSNRTTTMDDGKPATELVSLRNRLLLQRQQQQQQQLCQSLWYAMLSTKSSSDLADVVDQCERYVQQLLQTEIRLSSLLLDTSYLMWNESTEQCRRFNTEFRCNVMKEIHCHNDLDLLHFSLVMKQMGLTPMTSTTKQGEHDRSDDEDQTDNNIDWARPIREDHDMTGDGEKTTCMNEPVMVRIIRSDCHWDRKWNNPDCQYLRRRMSSSSVVVAPTSTTSGTSGSENNLVSEACVQSIIQSHDVGLRGCTSPENDVPWPLQGDTSSKTSNVTCGLTSDSPTSSYFRDKLRDDTLQKLTKNCTELIVYGVAFGDDFVQDMNRTITNNANFFDTHLQRHGRCFFMFTTTTSSSSSIHEEGWDSQGTITTSIIDDNRNAESLGHYWLISIPMGVLPYKNQRRNAKLLKYSGRLLFPNTDTIIWQDAKFFRRDMKSSIPIDYFNLIKDVPACVTAVGLPEHVNTVGKIKLNKDDHFYIEHCKTVKRAIEYRPNVTDSARSILQQCQQYIHEVQSQMGGDFTFLDRTMVDTAFIIWNESTEQCNTFNAGFRCTMLDELHCHSDRDQISLPYVLYKQQQLQQHQNTTTPHHHYNPLMIRYRGGIPLDARWSPLIHETDLVLPTIYGTNVPETTTTTNRTAVVPMIQLERSIMVRIIRTNCHWYKATLGRDCNYWKHPRRI
jgi:hypothetical protein